MSRHGIAPALVLAVTLALLSNPVAAQSMGTPADVVENFATEASGGEDLLLAENAHIERSADGITISLHMPTPEAGSYTYPETVPASRQAQPEVFTGWPSSSTTPSIASPIPSHRAAAPRTSTTR